MKKSDFLQSMRDEYGATAEYLWPRTPGNGVFRHHASSRWFCAILDIRADRLRSELLAPLGDAEITIVNVKAHPDVVGSWRLKPGILPGYHMNKEHWLSLVLDGYLTDDEIMGLVRESFQLTR